MIPKVVRISPRDEFDDLDVNRRLLVLIWEVTQACGLACRHCRADAKPERHPDELTTDEGKRLLADAAEFGDGQNVRDRSAVDIYRNSELFESLRDPDEYEGRCGACEFRQVCGGSRSRAFAATGSPIDSDPLCPYVPEGYDGELPATLADEGTGVPDAAD